MRCHCGYEGIPTVHHEDPDRPHPGFVEICSECYGVATVKRITDKKTGVEEVVACPTCKGTGHTWHHPHKWKCPTCHKPLPADLRHDWQLDEAAVDNLKWVCSQCGMRSDTSDEDRTPCPGHPVGAEGTPRMANCLCGEFGPDPGPYPATSTCKRCGGQYPRYNPPPPPKRDQAINILEQRLREVEETQNRIRQLVASGEPITMQALVECMAPKESGK